MGFTNVRITKDLVVKYGPTKGCLGCKRALGEITYYQGHTDKCRKRFLELSSQPGNEELKSRLDQSFERATRKYLDREEQEEEERRDKRMKTQDTRSQSKQNANQSSSSSSKPEEQSTGTKRTASKVHHQESDQSDEPEAKRSREDENQGMNDVQSVEVCEFYSVPRIAPRTVGKYVNKSMSFDINTADSKGNPWNFIKAERRQEAR